MSMLWQGVPKAEERFQPPPSVSTLIHSTGASPSAGSYRSLQWNVQELGVLDDGHPACSDPSACLHLLVDKLLAADFFGGIGDRELGRR